MGAAAISARVAWVKSEGRDVDLEDSMGRRFACHAAKALVVTGKHTAPHYSTLQHTATHCHTISNIEDFLGALLRLLLSQVNIAKHNASHCNAR